MLHVVAGLIERLGDGRTPARWRRRLRLMAIWAFVDVVWVIIFLLLYV